jgi:glycosyltransferase involved in cell wall biosynthesis
MFEAMAARVPIVLAVDGEARSTLERARAGVFVAPGDAAALATTIERLAMDAAVRREMGAAGGAFVEREFSRASWAAKYLTVLQRTAKGLTMGPNADVVHGPVQQGTRP